MNVTNQRFTVAPNGSINVAANISVAKLADLPECITDFTTEVFDVPLSSRARAGYATILSVVAEFFPNEFERGQIEQQLNQLKRG